MLNFGGIQGVAEALGTDLDKGRIRPGDDYASTPITEQLAPSSTRGFFGYLKKSCKNTNILLLSLYAVLSIGFGIKEEGVRTGWREGAIIMIAIIILVVAPSTRDFLRERLYLQKKKLHKPNLETPVEVIREGISTEISISNVKVGDVVCLKSQTQVPADGLFVSGDRVLVVKDGSEYSTVNEQNPFLFYGAKVNNGSGRMMITSLGMNTLVDELMNKVGGTISTTYNHTSLPAKLDKVSNRTQIAGLSISIIILLVFFFRFMLLKSQADSDLPETRKTTATKDLMDIINKIVMKPSGKLSTFTTQLSTILLIGTQEPVTLVIVFSIVYLRKKMFSGKAHADQDLLACVKMGSVDVIICTDRLYRPEVAKCYVDEKIIQKDCITDEIPRHVREALCICISTPISKPTTPCKSFEDPLLPWAASQLGMNMENLKQSCSILKMKSLNSNAEGNEVELMSKLGSDNERVCYQYWKGPAKTILAMCSHYYKITGERQGMEDKRGALKNIIEQMQSDNLETIAFSYKDIEDADQENCIIFVGMVGLEKSCSKEIHDAVIAHQNAGVKIVLTSEHNVSDTEDIARKCGLELPDQSEKSVVDGEVFGNLTDTERMDLAGNIIVMGNSHPSDTLLLVQCLKKKGNVVAMLGSTSTLSPALKEADVGIAMGFWSSEMARENSDFIIHNGNFSLLVNHTSRGRCIYNNILKYIQLVLAMTIAGASITLITTASLGHAPITGIQLILANLVVNLLGGFALLSEPPTEEQMHKPPVSPTQPFISKLMWRNIVSQALYQTTILVTFYFRGKDLLDLREQVCKSIVFNIFVLFQIFNLLNSRDPDKRSVFKGLAKNPCFGLAVVFILIPQIAFNAVENIIVGNTMLINLAQWGAALLIGSTSLLVDSAVKYCTPLLFSLLHQRHAGSASLAVTVSVPDRDSPSVSGTNTDGLELSSITAHEAIVSRTQPLHLHLA